MTTLEKKQSDACAVKICNNILEYEGNSNNNNFLHQANLLMTLDSNNTTDNGNGSAVIDGQNADQMENVEATSSENIESLQQKYFEIMGGKYDDETNIKKLNSKLYKYLKFNLRNIVTYEFSF